MSDARVLRAFLAGSLPYLLICLIAQASSGAPGVRVTVDDMPVPALTGAVINDVLYFPLRLLTVAMRAALVVNRRDLEIHRADGRIFTVRVGRREVWEGGVVAAVAEGPVLLTNGVTVVASGAVETLFDALVVWNKDQNSAAIITRSAFSLAQPDAPPARRPASPRAPVSTFVPEFVPQTARPVVASGAVGFALAGGAGSGLLMSSRLSFASRGEDDYLSGAFGIGAAVAGPVAADGIVTWRRGSSVLSAGSLSISESPLTLYQQGFVGLIYDQRFSGIEARFFGGILSGSNETVYGTSFRLTPVGALLPEATVLHSPDTGATIVRGRVDSRIGGGFGLFAEAAYGTSVMGSGTGWRFGALFSTPQWSASISYLAVSRGFPALGNAAVFAGRHGPELELAYYPNPRLLVLTSAAWLFTDSGAPRRLAYRLLAQYRISSSLAVVGEARSTDRPEGGLRQRRDTVQAGLVFASGRWTGALTVRHGFDEQVGVTTVNTTSFSLRAGYVLRNGWLVWAELNRYVGDLRGWAVGAGARLRLVPHFDLTAQLRAETITFPAQSWTRSLEVGLLRPLADGAELSVGAGLSATGSRGTSAATTPYLTVGYRRPFTIYGPLRVGRVDADVFIDSNGNGRFDVQESGVAGVIIRLDEQSAARTEPGGRAVITGVREGEYRVSVDETTIPVGLVAVQTDVRTRVAANGTAAVTFALVPTATVRCVVYLDENANGRRDPGELGVPDVGTVLQPMERRATTDVDGLLLLDNLKPGRYVVMLDARALPEGIKLAETTSVTAVVAAGAAVSCELPVLPARRVIITFP